MWMHERFRYGKWMVKGKTTKPKYLISLLNSENINEEKDL